MDVLTKFVEAATLGQRLPKLNPFRDSRVSQVHKYCSGVEKLNAIKYVKACRAHAVLSKVNQQVCSRRQGQRVSQNQINMFQFDSCSHSAFSRSIISNAKSPHSTTSSREQQLRLKRLSSCSKSEFWRLVRSGCYSRSRIRSDSELVVHADCCDCLSGHQEVDHEVKACSRTSRQCHSGEDSVHCPLSRVNQRLAPGGWIHLSRRSCQTLRCDSVRGC